MVNYTGKGGFGDKTNPSEAGRIGGKSRSIRKRMAKRITALSQMDFESYMKMVKRMNSLPNNPTYVEQLFLGGEEGMDTMVKALAKHLNDKSYNIEQLTTDDREALKLIKEQLFTIMQVKEAIYGKKTKIDAKAEITGQVWDAKKEFDKWLNGNKEGTGTEKDTEGPK